MICLLLFALALSSQTEPSHVFAPVDPAWTVVESTMKLGPEAFMVVNPGDRDPNYADYWLERRYFQDKRERKILVYDPKNRLREEIDITDQERFTRILRPDGSLSEYQTHTVAGFNAFNVSKDGKTIHRVQNGIGELVSEGFQEGERTHVWYMKGVYVEKRFAGDRCTRVKLVLGSDMLLAGAEGEHLDLHAECEHWMNTKAEGLWVQIMDSYIDEKDGKIHPQAVPSKADIRPMTYRISRRHDDDREANEIRKGWAVAWPKRRAGFINRYGDALKAAGQDWEKLGIDFIRMEGPWPN